MRGEFRQARVNSVDEKRHTAQVTLSDVQDDPVLSYDLQVLVTRPGDFSLPKKDSIVLCVFLEGPIDVGFVLGAFYSEADAAPTADKKDRVISSEKATMTLDKDGNVTVDNTAGSGDVLVKTKGKTTIDTAGGSGEIDLKSGGAVNITAAADMTIDAGSHDVTIKAGNIKCQVTTAMDVI
jgi:phage baseplate assembly protein gpV